MGRAAARSVVEVGIDGPVRLAIAYAALAGTLWAVGGCAPQFAGQAALAGACTLVAVAAAALLLRGHAPAHPRASPSRSSTSDRGMPP